MHTAVIITKTEPEVKAKAQKIAAAMGLSLTSIINRYLRHFIAKKTITFTARDEEPSAYLLKSLRQSDEDIKKGRVSPGFDNAKDAIAWLNKE